MRIGNTVKDVREFLFPETATLRETRATLAIEREVLGVPCETCGAVRELCISETGLPASGPHPKRILRSGVFR